MSGELSDAAFGEFLAECLEMLERFSLDLELVETGNYTPDTLAGIYRNMHTIKGNSQLFGFSQISLLTHTMETCLDPVRKEKIKVSTELIDCLFEGADLIGVLLKGIKETKQEQDTMPILTRIIPRFAAIAERAVKNFDSLPNDKNLYAEERSDLLGFKSAGVKTQKSVEPIVTPPPQTKQKETSDHPPSKDTSRVQTPASNHPPEAKPAHEDAQAETIRVHVSLLDNLMNLVGELVLVRNQVLQYSKSHEDDQEFSKMSQRLNVLTAELQNDVMKTRMQPVGNILNKFSRIVRDMGRELGKKIELDIEGAETELDKTIIEAVKDPLTHIVRNSIDHGIEMPEDRVKAGKKETGSIRIKAHHESGQVILEIRDDGRGLNVERLGSKAIEKGLITQDALSRMSEREIQNLIFAPGFSTAATVSNISGRGVGMDVVKTNVERIGGVVDLGSSVGKGTSITLKIPLTLAIVPALVVSSRTQRFAIPQAKLVELLRVDPSENSGEKIESLQGRPILRLRGKLLPLVSINEVTKEMDKKDAVASISNENCNIVILNADNFVFGLVVDEIDDSADIVVKSLPGFLKDLTIYSGATVMGNGMVALTLDILGVAKSLKIDASGQELSGAFGTNTTATQSRHRDEVTEFLLVDIGAPSSYALPLTVVSRLEEFDRKQFELSGEQRVIRYRGALLPLLSLTESLKLPFAHDNKDSSTAAVVVVARGDHLYGVEVNKIQDVVDGAQIDVSVRDRPGILGSIIFQDRIIVVVDIFGIIDEFRHKINSRDEDAGESQVASLKTERKSKRILVVEDSSFFRNLIKQAITDAGYAVDTACDGADGLTKIEADASGSLYSLIVSDIEMPVIGGLELAKKVRAGKAYANVPMVAVTTRFNNNDIELGMQAGFTKYLEKLNSEKLIMELDRMLKIGTSGGSK